MKAFGANVAAQHVLVCCRARHLRHFLHSHPRRRCRSCRTALESFYLCHMSQNNQNIRPTLTRTDKPV